MVKTDDSTWEMQSHDNNTTDKKNNNRQLQSAEFEYSQAECRAFLSAVFKLSFCFKLAQSKGRRGRKIFLDD